MLLAERSGGQLAPCGESHLQLPSDRVLVPTAAAAPVDDPFLPGRWLAVKLTPGPIPFALRLPDGTDCHFSLSENGTVLRKIP